MTNTGANTMPTIYVSHEPRSEGIDLQPLYDFADERGMDIKYIYTKGFNVSMHPQEALATAEAFAAGFDFDKDVWMVAGGDPLAGVICMVALVHEAIETNSKAVKSLRYIKAKDETGKRTIPMYIPLEISTGI
jgi:hypothetical protein